MPIEIITGIPGHGKTLYMIGLIHEAAKQANRPIFAAGIDGLQLGLAEVLDDPRKWALVPDGSLIFIDEGWKWFGHLHDARQAPTPPHVLALAEHRHRGIDFVMTTQQTNQLYPFVRGLVGGHTHIVRRFGTHNCDIYTWGQLCDDVKSQSQREAAMHKLWRYPSAHFESYKSATQHTIKRKIPWKTRLIPISVMMFVYASFSGYRYLHRKAVPQSSAGVTGVAGAPAETVTSSESKAKYSSAADYVIAHTPRVPGEPWSAPYFDGLAVTTVPDLLCMESGTPPKDTCHCYTEQATPMSGVDKTTCLSYATGGVYNPYREHPKLQLASIQHQDSKKVTLASVPLGGTQTPYAQEPGYGAIHTESAHGTGQ